MSLPDVTMAPPTKLTSQPADAFTPTPQVGPVAYLVSKYPSLSHAFIENEIEALRKEGVEVHTFTIRPSPASEQVSARSRDEASATTSLLGNPVDRWVDAALSTLRGPRRAVLGGARLAARSGPASARGRIWQAFYFAEATLLFDELRSRGIRHVHVHFANNGADVARLVVAMGLAAEGSESGWRWTMSMHGPTEFEQVDAFDLPAKIVSAHAIACISEYCRAQLMRHSPPQEWSKLGIVRMAVDTERFADATQERRQRGVGPLRVLFVGRLVPEKGPSVLLDAVGSLHGGSEPLDIEVRIVGSGPLLKTLQAQIHDRDLADVVTLLGPLGNDQLPTQYAWADVFCLPSFAEGVPVVLMEAMATALPVVTTSVAGVPELVHDGENGRLVGPGKPQDLADALRDLAIATPDDRARMGAAGRQHVQAEFNQHTNSRRLMQVLSG